MTYRLGNYEYVLLRSNERITDVDPSDLYSESQIIVGANHQTPFAQAKEAKIHEFLIARIEGSTEIKIVKRFILPYEEGYQALYFSEDFKFMLEMLENERIFFHEWIEDKKWKMQKRLQKYPSSIQGDSLIQLMLSPNFMLYLDYDVLK